MQHLSELFEEEEVLELYRQLITVTDQIWFDERLEAKGIYASSSLTNLMMDLCLSDLDRILDQKNIRFVRYGDDYMLFFKTPEQAADWFEKIRYTSQSARTFSEYSQNCHSERQIWSISGKKVYIQE